MLLNLRKPHLKMGRALLVISNGAVIRILTKKIIRTLEFYIDVTGCGKNCIDCVLDILVQLKVMDNKFTNKILYTD